MNTRRGHIANVTASVNEIVELITDDRNLQEVKEKLLVVEHAFLQFKGAHINYAAEVLCAEDKVKCDEYFAREEEKFARFYRKIQEWISRVEDNLVAVSLQVDSEINPEDSVSGTDPRFRGLQYE